MKAITSARASMLLAFLVAALASAPPARGQGTFELEYKLFEGEKDPLARVTQRWVGRLDNRPANLKGVPDALGEAAQFFDYRVGELPLLAAVEPGAVLKLYVDTDLDGDLADEQPADLHGWSRGMSMQGMIRFEPLLIKAEGGDAPSVQMSVWPYVVRDDVRYIFMTRSGAHVGKVKLGDDEYSVAFVDGTFDGRLDDPFGACKDDREFSRHDFFGIDLNGDGGFDDPLEIMPLPAMVKVGESYYALSVKPDGSSVTLEAATPKMGTLEPQSDAVLVGAWSTAGPFRLVGSEGPWALPVGTYQVATISLVASDDDDNRWEVRGTIREEGETFEIHEGETTRLGSGPPLVAKPDVSIDARQVRIGLAIVGQAGEPYSPAVRKNGRQRPAPKLRILDEKGTELASGRFEYG